MTTDALSAAAAGSWELGDLTVNRVGFGAMRLASNAPYFGGTSNDRDQSIAVLRRAVELGVKDALDWAHTTIERYENKRSDFTSNNAHGQP